MAKRAVKQREITPEEASVREYLPREGDSKPFMNISPSLIQKRIGQLPAKLPRGTAVRDKTPEEVMSTAKVRIYKTGSPAGWAWSFDVTTNPDAVIDNIGTATAAAQAIDAVKPLVAGMPGTLSEIDMTVRSYEP